MSLASPLSSGPRQVERLQIMEPARSRSARFGCATALVSVRIKTSK